MNALADVASAPTDLTARTVVLTRMDEAAARMRSASDQLDQIAAGVRSDLDTGVQQANDLAGQIARLNELIVRAQGSGKAPNDLLDQRDQAIRNLNQYVQTTQVPADDGSLGVFVGNQPLVLGTTAGALSVGDAPDFPGSGQLKLFFTAAGGTAQALDEQVIGGGSMAGQLKFYNNDLEDARNLLGRMSLAIGSTMNYQQSMGLTLDGATGKPLFSTPASVNGLTTGSAVGQISFSTGTFTTPSQFAASDYEVRFTTPPAGQVIRLSDGKTTAFTDLNDLRNQQIDGLTFDFTTAGAANERVLFRPFANAAGQVQALVRNPSQLAVANPVNAAMGTANTGSLQLANLKATGYQWNASPAPGQVVGAGVVNLPPATGVVMTFTGSGTFTLSGNAHAPLDMSASPPAPLIGPTYTYTPGQSIDIDGWQITLQGTPNVGDTVTVGNAKLSGDTYTRDAGNAKAMLALRDAPMFDGAPLSDGFASAMAQVGTRTQSAQFAAQTSSTIAADLENDRTAVSGVNLDEEAAKLIQYQQAYQASAKMIQVAQTVFDSLLQTMG